MAYNYGPPPPAPATATAQSTPTYASYYPSQVPRGGFGGHGGRGRGGMAQGSDRGGYQAGGHSYGYGAQQPTQQAYGTQGAPLYPSQHSTQPIYPPPQPHQQQHQPHPHPQQPWQPEQPNHHQQNGSLSAQNYHPNYAPQMYQPPHPQQAQHIAQQQASYPTQQPYTAAPPPPYGQGYPQPAPTQQPPPPVQHWGGPVPPPQSQGHYGGGGRGRGGHGDRGAKSQMMGPPIRMGFDHGNPPVQPALVSSPYPPQPYSGPQTAPAPYPPPTAPYQGYSPTSTSYMPSAPQYDGNTGYNSRNRGGPNHNNSKSRSHLGGDKMRNRNRGFNNAHTPPIHHQKPDAASSGKKKKRKTNTLGLTPGDESEEDDENEEQRLNELYGADAPNPATDKDIAEWIAERRANYPSKARAEARKAVARQQNGDSKREKDLEQKAERLRKQLKKVESSIKRKREQQDEGDEMRDVEVTSSSSDEAKSEDDKPEVMSTRTENSHLPPPPKKADPTKHCKYYSTGGNCGKKGKCRFVHDPAVREAALKDREMNGGRMTLQQRLTLNDKDQEDLTIVQTLKYLQDRGMMEKGGPSSSSKAASSAQPSSDTSLLPTPERMRHGLPPIPPPTALPPSIKYHGWNMGGFGNTGVKPEFEP